MRPLPNYFEISRLYRCYYNAYPHILEYIVTQSLLSDVPYVSPAASAITERLICVTTNRINILKADHSTEEYPEF